MKNTKQAKLGSGKKYELSLKNQSRSERRSKSTIQNGRIQSPYHFSYIRSLKKLIRGNPKVLSRIASAVEILKHDPYNTSRQHLIKKLEGAKPSEGQWRIRSGDYRILYDILGKDVVLYLVADRKDAYRK